MRRNAIRLGANEVDSTAFAVNRYGKIEQGTMDEIVAWLKDHKDEYTYEVGEETIVGFGTFPIIKTIRKGSSVFKILDNEHDAQNTLANIRNKDFPKNKQGQ